MGWVGCEERGAGLEHRTRIEFERTFSDDHLESSRVAHVIACSSALSSRRRGGHLWAGPPGTLPMIKLRKNVNLHRNRKTAVATPRDAGGAARTSKLSCHDIHRFDSRRSRASKHCAPHAPPAESALSGFH